MNQTRKTTALLFNSLYAIVLFLFFMDWYTCVEIKSEPLKSFAYWGLLAGTPLIIVFNVIILPKGFKKSFGIIIPTLVLLYIILSNPLAILFNKDNWKTQTIIYKSCTSHNKTIEYRCRVKEL